MIELPKWAYYTAHVLLAIWFLLALYLGDFVGAILLVIGYSLGRALRDDE